MLCNKIISIVWGQMLWNKQQIKHMAMQWCIVFSVYFHLLSLILDFCRVFFAFFSCGTEDVSHIITHNPCAYIMLVGALVILLMKCISVWIYWASRWVYCSFTDKTETTHTYLLSKFSVPEMPLARDSPKRWVGHRTALSQCFRASWAITKPKTMWSWMRFWWKTLAQWAECLSKSTSLMLILINSRRTWEHTKRSKVSISARIY